MTENLESRITRIYFALIIAFEFLMIPSKQTIESESELP